MRRWWQHPVSVILLLIFFPPAGIALAWLTHWSTAKKIVATALSLLWFVVILVSDPKTPQDDAKSKTAPKHTVEQSAAASPAPRRSEPPSYVGKTLKEARDGAAADGYNAVSHDASDGDAKQWDADNWHVCFQKRAKQAGPKPTLDFGVVESAAPCPDKDGNPIPWPKMPDVGGWTFAKAAEAVEKTGITKVEAQGAYTDVTPPAEPDDWKVCFQEPEANKEIRNPEQQTAYLKVAEPGTSCPRSEGSKLHPEPDPPGRGDDDSNTSGGSTSSGGSGDATGSWPVKRPGSFCSPAGARAVSSSGTPLVCGPASDGRNRWHA
ncbi:PASTA domain-containing protein [Streptomyces chattanoogensis]|uniref:PASTA domain-containing protein n=1 Tax=Streptomyces chattanoogensis TaxID=66876 RepID=UPI0036A2A3D6